jgi:type IX secretion system PorP/SprF family membrane protein
VGSGLSVDAEMKKETFYFIVFLIASVQCVWGQNPPAFRQFYLNPFLFNSAYTGLVEENRVTLFYRKQWIGFEDAPSVSGFSVQRRFKKNLAGGLTFYSQEAVALRNTSMVTTFSYAIPLSEKFVWHAALSGGIGNNDLKTGNGNYGNDPAIARAAGNRFFVDGNFGTLLVSEKWEFGFALPRLFGQRYVSPGKLDGSKFSQLLNQLYSISYRKTIQDYSFKPYLFYRLNRDLQNSWELGSIVYYKNMIWAGAAYQHVQGMAFFFGARKSNFHFGYSFELPPLTSNFYNTTSHEFTLGYQFKKKNSVSDEPKTM